MIFKGAEKFSTWTKRYSLTPDIWAIDHSENVKGIETTCQQEGKWKKENRTGLSILVWEPV